VTTRKHGTKPNLNAQKRRSAQAHALEGKQYRPRVVPDKRMPDGSWRSEWISGISTSEWNEATQRLEAKPTMYGRDKRLDWQGITLAATNGTKLGAILRAAYGEPHEDGIAWFGSHATVTSDGFLIADFVESNGEYHMGAFVGSLSDLKDNLGNLARHCKLTEADAIALECAVTKWYGQ
jgi:hypothetical protein